MLRPYFGQYIQNTSSSWSRMNICRVLTYINYSVYALKTFRLILDFFWQNAAGNNVIVLYSFVLGT